MGILSVAGKAVRTVARYAVGNGGNTIAKARKSVINPNKKSIFGKGNEFALNKNTGKKISAGWNALKKDVKRTANSKKGVWDNIKDFGKGIVSKAKAGIRLAEAKAAKAGKTATKWAKTAGAIKGVCKGLRRLPVIGTVLGLGWEAYECYDAFKRGGVLEGIKQIGVSALKLTAGAVGCAIGTVLGGPVIGAAGFVLGDMLAGYLVVGSYSDNHPEDEEIQQEEKIEEQPQIEEQEEVQTTQQGTEEVQVQEETEETPVQETRQEEPVVTQNDTDEVTNNTNEDENITEQEAEETADVQQQGDNEKAKEEIAQTTVNPFAPASSNPFTFSNPYSYTNFTTPDYSDYGLGYGTLGMYNGTFNTGYGMGYMMPSMAYSPFGTMGGFTPFGSLYGMGGYPNLYLNNMYGLQFMC